MQQVIDVLDVLNVPYLVGGSFASSIYGTYRATAEVDLVADLRFEHVATLVKTLRDQVYIDEDSVGTRITIAAKADDFTSEGNTERFV